MNKINYLEVHALAKSYQSKTVVHSVSLQVKSGQVVGLLGPNGAGKTTTFYMIVGLIQPDSGHILLNQENISLAPMHKRARHGIGYLPQEACIFTQLSVADNLMAVLEARADLNMKQRHLELEALLKEFKLTHIERSLGMSLSGGERRRVEIARCLASNPKFILLDEPFAGVDPISVIDIKKIIKQLQARGLGVLITDHNVRETLDVCEHAYIVSKGGLIANGKPAHILNHQEVRDVYLGEHFQI